MANVTVTTTWVLDTVGVIKDGGPVRIRYLLWVSDAASGKDIAADDDLVIREARKGQITAGGYIRFSKRAEAAGDGLELVFGNESGFLMEGFDLHTMAGGILIVGLA